MPLEKATALVIRNTDFSETSRISTLWTREFGKVRVLAKGGRRLKSSFESGLDLLSLCSIVLLRKTSGSLDLLTEARVSERFGRLRNDLPALYAGYYLAEVLGDLTEDYDPHPALFDEALETLRELGNGSSGPRLARFELVLLRELGFGPSLDACAACQCTPLAPRADAADKKNPQQGGIDSRSESTTLGWAFSPAAGGILCPACFGTHRDRRPLPPGTLEALRNLRDQREGWKEMREPALRREVRQVLNLYVTYLLGRPPRLLPYLGS